MAKMTSLSGAVTGKLAGNVYSVSAGQQIVRAYQPNVANPNTELQVENRTKFKLASQLAAAVSPVLAIRKQGLVSGRNQFVKNTMGAIAYALGEATILLNRIQLTDSSIELPSVSVARGAEDEIQVHLNGSAADLGVTKVVYALFSETPTNKLNLFSSIVVSEAGDFGTFPGTFNPKSNQSLLCYAYGIIEDDNNVLAKYDSYKIERAEFIASLISSRSTMSAELKTTSTRYAQLPAKV